MIDEALRACVDPELRAAGFRAWLAALVQPCECCEFADASCSGELEHVRPMTLYGDEPDHYVMCSTHAEEYREHWTEMWAEYHAGCM